MNNYCNANRCYNTVLAIIGVLFSFVLGIILGILFAPLLFLLLGALIILAIILAILFIVFLIIRFCGQTTANCTQTASNNGGCYSCRRCQ